MRAATLLSFAVPVAASAAISAGLIFLLKPLLIRHLLAHPNARSSHSIPTPQGAGLGLMAAVLAVCLAGLLLGVAVPPPSLAPALVAAAVLTLMGALDDAYGLPVGWRFCGQFVAALGIALFLPEDVRLLPDLLPLAVERVLIVLGIMWFVNAVNFLDGLDWMTVVQVVPMTLGVAILHGFGIVPATIGLLALALLGATLGFAPFNKNPAQIFLGDAGSLPIGLCLALLLIYVADAHLVSGLLLALYTLADSTLTLLRRLIAGERIFSAHKKHFYQRAVARGLSVPQVTARVALLEFLLMGLAIAAALARSLPVDLLCLGLGVLATGLMLWALSRGR
jgi:UDP-N-acetylmuramyl pentapeptide phosphotransferase/UDP-N-acetylglucosamine-1-phosphate transferase